MNRTDVFVIGTGPAGMAAARTIKMKSPNTEVVATKLEQSYVPCALPYALSGMIKIDSYLKNEAKLMTDIGIKVLSNKVVQIKPDENQVVLDNGDVYSYKKLIASPGAEPIIPPIPGINAKGIFSVRTPLDIHNIHDFLKEGMKISVIGSGYIGIEMACMLKEGGFDVTIIELLERVLPKTSDLEFSNKIQDQLSTHNITLKLGTGAKEFISNAENKVTEILLSDGSKVATDLVVMSLGVKPRLELFKNADFETKRDGVVVNEKMETSKSDVYACGDCVHFKSFITNQPFPGKLATNGIFQGKTAALNAIGKSRIFDGFINTAVTDVFGLKLGSSGIRVEEANNAGIETITGTGISKSAYPMFTELSKEVKVQLVFRKNNGVVIGGQVIGYTGIAERLDLIAFAIHNKHTYKEIALLHHCAHPVQSGVPAHNPIVMAAEDAMSKF